MASMRDIKRRKESISSTGQITKAMKLVSTVKLQKSKSRAESCKPYFDYMYNTVTSILDKAGDIDHPYLQAGESSKKAVIVISSNRGLAGGYNSNVVKAVLAKGLNKEDVEVYAVGRKGRDALARKGYKIKKDYSEVMNNPLYSDASEIGEDVLAAYAAGEISEIYLAYTEFVNTVTQNAKMVKLLPVSHEAKESEQVVEVDNSVDALTLMNFEPEAEEALDLIIPKYIKSLLYGGLMESIASENGARMQSMDSATNNANDMISKLELSYNRARQAAITQELTEIVAGASAIS